MLRVTPLYGSRWDKSGASRSGSCTLVEYADVKVLVDVGLRNSNGDGEAKNEENTGGDDNSNDNNEDSSSSLYSFWENLPPHDCLVLTDSTLESMGSLPLYVEGIRRAAKKHRRQRQTTLRKQEVQDRRSSTPSASASASFLRRRSSSNTNIERRISGLIADNLEDEFDEDLNDAVPPIFATFPTVKMGQMSLYDHHANISLDGGTPPFTMEEMDRAIAMLRTIKYSQTLNLPMAFKLGPPPNSTIIAAMVTNSDKTNDTPRLSVTAHRAGHVVGGAFYRFERLRDNTTVVLTGNAYHIAKELHLDACTLLKNGTGADVLVTRPGGPACPLVNGLYSSSSSLLNKNKNSSQNKKKKKQMMTSPLASKARRDLTERVLGFLRRDANVLLPVDASGRALELILLLSRFWSKQNLAGSYNLVWFGSMVHNTLEFSRSQLEWMNASLGNNIYDTSHRGRGGKKNDGDIDHGQHPYLLRHVKLCTNMAELDKVLAESNDNPTCVLANGLTLDHGPARDLFLRWADNDNNAVIFTDSSQCLERNNISSAKDATLTTMTNAAIETATTTVATTTATPGVSATAPTGAVTVVAAAIAATDNEADGVGVDPVIEDSMMGTAITEDEASSYTAAYQLLKHWCLAKAEDREMDDIVNVDVLIPRRTPLIGNELVTFSEREEAARVAQREREEEQAMLREVELAKGRLRLGEDNTTVASSGAATSSAVATASNTTATGAGTSSKVAHLPFFRPKKKSRFDSSLFLKFSKPLHLTFELREDAVGVGQRDITAKFGIGESIENSEVLEDDYGIAVIPDQFRDIVTGVDPSKFGAQKDEINKRGLGFASSSGKDDKKKGGGKKKRRNDGLGLNDDDGADGNDDNDEDDDMDERGLEAVDLSEGKGIIRGRNGRPPTKVSTVNRRIEVVAEIDYIPFEGRVDSRAARQSVRALQPRQVVVLGGTKPGIDGGSESMDVDNTEQDPSSSDEQQSTESILLVDEVKALADAAQGFVVSQKEPVLTPSDAETVELKVGHNAYPARLVATPFRTKEERKLEEVVPDPIELTETKIGACTVSLLDFVMTGQKVALDGSIVIAPRNKKSSSSSLSIFAKEQERPPVYVSDGEVLLTDLRTELIAQQGMKAEYSAHAGYSQLIVNGRIVVKKRSDGTGKIDVEGPLCEDFFTVRSVVCSQYVTLGI